MLVQWYIRSIELQIKQNEGKYSHMKKKLWRTRAFVPKRQTWELRSTEQAMRIEKGSTLTCFSTKKNIPNRYGLFPHHSGHGIIGDELSHPSHVCLVCYAFSARLVLNVGTLWQVHFHRLVPLPTLHYEAIE